MRQAMSQLLTRRELLTSLAVLCVPTMRIKEAGCLSKVTDCQDL